MCASCSGAYCKSSRLQCESAALTPELRAPDVDEWVIACVDCTGHAVAVSKVQRSAILSTKQEKTRKLAEL